MVGIELQPPGLLSKPCFRFGLLLVSGALLGLRVHLSYRARIGWGSGFLSFRLKRDDVIEG